MVIRQNASGYSLYELIITVGIAALLMSLGVPSYGKMLANHHLKVEVDAIFHAVHLARKESVVRRRADENQHERADEFGQSRFLIFLQ